jgi:hypothetical protein
MSALSDALAALKNVVLIQERLDVVRREVTELAGTVDKLDDRVIDIDKRVVRIETMIELSRQRGSDQPRIEG